MKSKKTLIIAVVVLAVAIAAVLGFTMKPAEKAEHDYFIVNQGDKALVMDTLNPGKVVAELENNNINNITYCSKDSSSFILRENDSGNYPALFDLVHYDVSSGKKTVLDKNVTDYVVTEDFKTFLYAKGNDSKLYKKALSDSEATTIAENVYRFYMTDDGETIIYGNSDGESYLKNGDTEAVCLGEDVKIIYFERTSGNFVYIDGTKLFIHKDGNTTTVTEKLYTGDGTGHIGSCDNFYFAEKQSEFAALDLIEDNLNGVPEISDREAYELRNRIEDFFSEEYYNYNLFKIFYYDNGKISEVCDNVINVFNSFATSPADKISGLFECIDLENKFNLSEFYNLTQGEEIDGIYCNWFNAMKIINIAKKDTVVKTLENKHLLDCVYNYNTNDMYLLISDNTDIVNMAGYISNIYKMSLEIGKDEMIEIDTDKYGNFFSAAEIEGDIFYNDFNADGYSLYKSGESVVQGVDGIYEIGEDIFCISKIEDDKEKLSFYFDGEIHEYPEIDISNRYAYTTEKDNIIVWDTVGQYFYIINGETSTKIDKEYESIITFDGEPYEYALNEYPTE